MSMKTLADAFYDEPRDVLSAEKQLVRAIPKLAKKASREQLAATLEDHLSETEKQVERVEQAFGDTGKAARAKTCEAMKGLVTEAEEMLKDEEETADKKFSDLAKSFNRQALPVQ